MYVATLIENSEVTLISETFGYQEETRYQYFENENMAFMPGIINVFEVEGIPEGVEPNKYCYTEADGFYINPNYVEPDPTNTYGIPDDTYHAIINDLTTEVANSGY